MRQSKHAQALFHLIENRQMTSVELARAINVGYPPRKIQLIEQLGVRIIHDRVPYKTSEGVKTMIARYTLLSPIAEAKKIYKAICK